jgi:hypothetical protein
MNSSKVAAIAGRREQLRNIANGYFDALRRKDFSAIPYDDNAILRAPLAPGGVNHPLTGKDALYSQWWIPLEPALEGVEIVVLEHYFNDALTMVCSEATITLNVVSPPATLRVADRFTVNAAGKITDQENHFDPRDVTNPGWQNS